MEESMSFGSLVQRAREARGWKPADLRRALEDRGTSVSHTTVRGWEENSFRPTVEHFNALVSILACDGDDGDPEGPHSSADFAGAYLQRKAS